ncbi:MAG TPA: T9SS type A sorting domain-containing protein [Ignavibacteriaceae bacterium]|nr:T9SS type A sorting domain-containing protein [Ignavibacteriaceae bacterium]
MRTLKISLLVFILQIAISAQWYDKSNNLQYSECRAFDAFDSLIAAGPFTRNSSYVLDSLYMTTNGGDYWFGISFPSGCEPGEVPIDISVKGSDKIWFCTSRGKIYRTTDGGLNWQLQFYNTLMTEYMLYIEMFDEILGVAVGAPPTFGKPLIILSTIDGGMNWISQNDSELIDVQLRYEWRSVHFVNIDIGYVFQNFPWTIYRTTNGGKNWDVINDTIDTAVLKAYDDNILLVKQDHGTNMYRTFDGGQIWESNDMLEWGSDIEFIPGNPSNVWCGVISVNFSSDTGRTWIKEFDFPQEAGRLYDMDFTDENSGWIYTSEGAGVLSHIYRTTNGGHGGIVAVDENDFDINLIGFKLEQNYPNPFNPITSIQYAIGSLPDGKAGRQFVTLKVYDLLGREIATLVNEEKPAGEYEVEFNGSTLPSGIYFYQLKAGEFSETKKMLLLK